MLNQTVAAVSTPPGKGGIAVIRISGPASYEVAARVFYPRDKNKTLAAAKGYTALFGDFRYRDKFIDEGVALCFRAPHSYTGEDVVELSCHGGEAVSSEVMSACIEAGAFPAGPGEFTKRAVLGGRISLTQAEAVMDLISATSGQGVAAAKAALSGALYKEIDVQKQKLVTLAGHLAAYTDYPEEDVEALTQAAFLSTLAEVRAAMQSLVDGYSRGSILRRGVRAAIVGSPNVGKSTLFNLLSGYDRAIVTPVAGTTRDIVRESIQIGGISLNLSDTAGLHQTDDIVEAEGIRRSYDEIEQAGFVIAVFDGSQPLSAQETQLLQKCAGRPALAIVNKSDLGTVLQPAQLAPHFTKVVFVSARDPQDRETVEAAVLEVLNLQHTDADGAILANERQLSAAVSAVDALRQAEQTLLDGLTFDAAGVFLDDALHALALLTGEDATEAILEEVFSQFCVGK